MSPAGARAEDPVAGIRRVRVRLGPAVAIAAHHYQRPEIVALADFTGDSYRLAVEAAASRARYIVFCGVRFMAESAAILARPGQEVLIPDPGAGCPMADMIDAAAAAAVLARLDTLTGSEVAPVTYMNSSADMKAVTGARGGSVCTSGNAAAVLSRFLDRGRSVFFSPDRNLGWNTARALGLDGSRVFTVRRDGSIDGTGDPSRAALFLWDGHCHVHRRFTVADLEAARARVPGVTVMVHPECDGPVAAAADRTGSTEAILEAVRAGGPGSAWAVGTEAGFVHRLAAAMPDRTVLPLRESYCMNMARIDAAGLYATLRSVEDRLDGGTGPLYHPVTVGVSVREDAARALTAMIDTVAGAR